MGREREDRGCRGMGGAVDEMNNSGLWMISTRGCG